MKLTVYSYTNQGGRGHNEDCLRYCVDDGRGIFVLADGLGGHLSGEVASKIAVDTICNGCAAGQAMDQETLKALLCKANQNILAGQNTAGQETMKTTAVVLYLEGEQVQWAYIGDSRLYHFSDGEVRQLTADHSVTYRKYLGGEISYMDICHDDDRSSLLRVLGKPSCVPETGEMGFKAGDAFLLCSDGFWEFVYNEEMLIDFLAAETPAQWAERMLLRHIRRTPEETDNFSLIAVFAEEEA